MHAVLQFATPVLLVLQSRQKLLVHGQLGSGLLVLLISFNATLQPHPRVLGVQKVLSSLHFFHIQEIVAVHTLGHLSGISEAGTVQIALRHRFRFRAPKKCAAEAAGSACGYCRFSAMETLLVRVFEKSAAAGTW